MGWIKALYIGPHVLFWPKAVTSFFICVFFTPHILKHHQPNVYYLWKVTESLYVHINTFSMGTVFRRQKLTSIDVRFRRLKSIPALKELENV